MSRETDEPEIVPYYDKNLGGVRPGSGRPKGSMSPERKLILETEKAMKKRIAKMADKLLNSQLMLAMGETSLYVKTVRGNKTITSLVDDHETIVKYLNGELEDDNNEYYYLATKSPDNKALDSLLDRTYGKARQSVDITSGDEPINTTPVSAVILANFKQYMLESTKDGNKS